MNQNTYIIGEIGQNHNGSVDVAKLMMDLATRTSIKEDFFNLSLAPLNAVKLTKRDLEFELSQSQMNRIYDNPNSFGKTYGEHRAKLELNDEQHFECYVHAKSLGLDFIETLCAVSCLSILKYFTPDKLKVASRDLTNLPLLNALAETKIPLIISTGMAGKNELDDALNVITKYHNEIAILHCVSEYPTNPINVNLKTIPYLIKNYPNYSIGYSDHTVGIATPLAAVAMGAEIIEKHITIDRRMKGTDQAGSLGPDGLNRLVRDIRLLEWSLGKEEIILEPGVEKARTTLERSISTKRDMKKGEIIELMDIHLLSPGDGFKWNQKHEVIGQRINCDIPKNETIYKDFLV